MISSYKYFTYENREGVGIFTINRPEVRNAMNAECWQELAKFIDEAEFEDEIKIIVITGAGEKAFISGADINSLKIKKGVENLRSDSRIALQKIEESPKPVIAAVNALAFGGGFEVAMACDIRIVVKSAKFGLPEVNLGVMPGAGGTQRLTRIAGVGVAKEVILAGRIITGEEAVGMGLAMKAVEREELIDAAIEVAKVMIAKGPVALHVAKKMVNHALDVDRNSGFWMENLGFAVLLETEDKLEGTTAFLEKRTPDYKGR